MTVSKPELALVPSANGATVQCAVPFSLLRLHMEFLDGDNDDVLLSAEPKFHLAEGGFVNVTLEMLVPKNVTRFVK